MSLVLNNWALIVLSLNSAKSILAEDLPQIAAKKDSDVGLFL